MVLWTKWSVCLLATFITLSAAQSSSTPPSSVGSSSMPSSSSTSQSSSTSSITSDSTTSTSSSSSTSTSSSTTESTSTTTSLPSSTLVSSTSSTLLPTSLSSLSSITSLSQFSAPSVITSTTSTSVTQSSATSSSATATTTNPSQGSGSNSVVVGAAVGGTVGALLLIAGIWYCTRSLRKKDQMTDFDEEIFNQPYASAAVRPTVKPVNMSQRPLGGNPEDAYQDINQMRQSYVPRSPGYQPYQPPIRQTEAQLGYQPGYQPYNTSDEVYTAPVATGVNAGYGSAAAAQEAYYQNQQYQQQQQQQQYYQQQPNKVMQQPYQGRFSPAPDVNYTEDTHTWPSRPSSDNGVSAVAMSESRTAYDDDRSDVGLYKPDQVNFGELDPHGVHHTGNVERFSKPDSVDLYGGMALDEEA